jgi:hypothetical protein
MTPIRCELPPFLTEKEIRVGLLNLGPWGKVSTVFLSLDHSWHGPPPVLWETMVFGGLLDGEQERYTSYRDAVRGHRRMCWRVLLSHSGGRNW